MKKIGVNLRSLVSAVLLLALIAVVILLVAMKSTDGRLIYCLDDTYIHMSIAKNVIDHSVWGVTQYGFSSSSSSIIWPILMVLGYLVTGVNEWMPFFLCCVCAVILTMITVRYLSRYYTNPLAQFGTAILVLIMMCVPTLIFSGMEHILHALLSLAFVERSVNLLTRKESGRRDRAVIVLLSILLTSTRFEGVFLVLVVASLFLLKRRSRDSFLILCAGFFPIAAFAVFSVSNGSNLLPNSLLLKGHSPSISTTKGVLKLVGGLVVKRLFYARYLTVLLVMSVLLVWRHIKVHGLVLNERIAPAVIFIPVLLLHLEFAGLHAFYRYDSYLIMLGLVAIFIAATEFLRTIDFTKLKIPGLLSRVSLVTVVLLLFYPLVSRSLLALQHTPKASQNIFEQQYQMAQFLDLYFEGKTVAANDIGAINFFSDIRCVDLMGLADDEVTSARLNGKFSPAFVDSLTGSRKVDIAILYDKWFVPTGGLPSNWRKLGEWKVDNSVVLGSDRVSFYAVDPYSADGLAASLSDYSTRLPSGVTQIGISPK